MRRLVFIDDDETELEEFGAIVRDAYDYTSIHWPDESAKLLSTSPPSVFVSDLYLPPANGGITPTSEERGDGARAATRLAERFSRLYADVPSDDKARLKETMRGIADAYEMLKLQWKAFGTVPRSRSRRARESEKLLP